VVPQLVPAFDWRAPYVSGAVVAALAFAAVLACPPTLGHGGRRPGPAVTTLLSDRRLIRLGLIASVSFGFSVILGNWVVTLLERTGGYHKAAAGAIGSLILILGIVGRPTGGILVRALPQATWRVLAASFALGALGTALLTISAGRVPDVLGAVLAGLAAGLPFGATMAGASAAYPSAPGAAVGAMNTYPVIVIVAGAPLIGLTFSLPGHGRIGVGLLAALWACAILAIPWRRPLRLSAGEARSDATPGS
jgi:predicted MFS family arabinose efflux permease